MEGVEELCAITGLDAGQAFVLLEAAGGDLAVAVQLHFDSEEGMNRPGNSAADEAAARAAQMDEDAANYGGHYGGSSDEDDGNDHADFPEPVADDDDGGGGGGGGGGGRMAARRRAHSPGAGPRGAPPPPTTRMARLYAAFGWLVSQPGISLIYRLLLGGGRFLYATGLLQLIGTVLWTPLAMLGLVAPAPPPPPPAAAAQRFETMFEERYGALHPPFFRGSCQSAIGRSRSEAKFVLVYLHDSGAEESAQFCERVLSSARFSGFVAEHFVFWVGDLASPEGRSVRRALRATQLPTLVVLAHGEMAAAMGGAFGGGGFGGAGSPGGDAGAPPAPVQALGTVAGARALDENSLIASLRGIVDAFEPLLVAARAEQNERLVERMMREQQEEEYARSLAEDQAREAREAEAGAAAAAVARAAAAEAAAAQAAAAQAEAAAEAKRAARAAKATTLAPEPTAGADDATRLVIRLSDGRRLDRRFGKRERLQAVVDYIESELPDIYDGADFELVSNYPRKVFSAETRSATLEALGLCPQATLFTKEMDEA